LSELGRVAGSRLRQHRAVATYQEAACHNPLRIGGDAAVERDIRIAAGTW
jgi:hypothetical protein